MLTMNAVFYVLIVLTFVAKHEGGLRLQTTQLTCPKNTVTLEVYFIILTWGN